MGKGKVAIAVVSVVAFILLLAFVVVPALTPTTGGSMSVQFFNDGEPVSDPITYGFQRDGTTTIDEIRVTVGWTITGSDPAALELGTDLTVSMKIFVEKLSIQTNQFYWAELDSYSVAGIQTLADSRTASFMLTSYADLDPTVQTTWNMKVEGLISVVVYFEDGSTQEATWPADGNPKIGTFSLSWATDSAGATALVLDGYWSY